jgi:hypothetical protein
MNKLIQEKLSTNVNALQELLRNEIGEIQQYDRSVMESRFMEVISEHTLDMTDEEILNIQNSWEVTEKSNNNIRRKVDQIEVLLNSIIKTFAPRRRKMSCLHYSYLKPFPHEIIVDGVRKRIGHSPCTLIELVQYGRKVRETTLKYQQKKNEFDEKTKTLYFETFGSQTTYIPLEEMKVKLDEYLRDKFVKENYPDGYHFDEFDGMNCENCSGWTVGEHRCDCGNRRVDLVVEGNYVTGYYALAEAY